MTTGKFSYDENTGRVSGPAKFMNEKGSAILADINAGRLSDGFLAMVDCAPKGTGCMQLVLVYLQTHYAAWRGMQQIKGMQQAAA